MIQRKRHWVEYGNRKYQIRANVHTIGGYSAHADQQNLVDFVKGMQRPPGDIVLVHGEDDAKEVLRDRLTHERLPVRD